MSNAWTVWDIVNGLVVIAVGVCSWYLTKQDSRIKALEDEKEKMKLESQAQIYKLKLDIQSDLHKIYMHVKELKDNG
jgi:uncharacterized protein YicC (UPF0701 family)